MSIESHVVSLEMAKKLKEAGWKKETEFWWSREKEQDKYKLTYSYSKFQSADPLPHFAAPLATEILDELPISLKGEFIQDLTIRKDDEGYFNINYGCRILVSGIGLPDTFAKMWIWLKKEKLL